MLLSNTYAAKKSKLNTIVEDLKKGDNKSLSFIFNNYKGLFLSIASGYSNNPEVVKDLVQEGFTKIYKNIHKYRNNGNFEGWMKRILTNYCIDYTRSLQARHDKLALQSQLYNDGEAYMSENVIPDSGLRINDLEQFIEQLPKGYKKVLKMYCIEGFSHKEIGEELGIEASSSRSQLMKAKNKLKVILQEEGYDLN